MVFIRNKVKVAVRIRPRGISDDFSLIKVSDDGQIQIKEKSFEFDNVFDGDSSQKDVFDSAVKPLINSFIRDSVNSAIMVYGQTGSGKTYTMGTDQSRRGFARAESGLLPRFLEAVFGSQLLLNNEAYINIQFLELYNEEIRDLLHKKGARPSIRLIDDKNGVIVNGLSSRRVCSVNEAMTTLFEGSLSRTTGATSMNAESSRSHAIFTVILTKFLNGIEYTSSKFNFVDLAGSERLHKTNAVGARAKESISINYGLLALGNVINALSKGDHDLASKVKRHVPYRDSKLTRLLEDSLGGSSKCLLIACVSPSSYNILETINTLNYATRVKFIENKISVNQRLLVQPKDDNITCKRLQQRILDLEAEVSSLKSAAKCNKDSLFMCELDNIMDLQKQTFESTCHNVAENVDNLCSLLSYENDLQVMKDIEAAKLSNNISLNNEKMWLQQKINNLTEYSFNNYLVNNPSVSTVDHFVIKLEENIKKNSLRINKLIVKNPLTHKKLSKPSCHELRWKYLLNFISQKYILKDCLYKDIIKQYERQMSKLHGIIASSLSSGHNSERVNKVLTQLKLQAPSLRPSISERKTPLLAMKNLENQLDYLFPLCSKENEKTFPSQLVSIVTKELLKDVRTTANDFNDNCVKENVSKTIKRKVSRRLDVNVDLRHYNQGFVNRDGLCIPIIKSTSRLSATKIIKRARTIIASGDAKIAPLSTLNANRNKELDYDVKKIFVKKPECMINFIDNFRRRNLLRK